MCMVVFCVIVIWRMMWVEVLKLYSLRWLFGGRFVWCSVW